MRGVALFASGIALVLTVSPPAPAGSPDPKAPPPRTKHWAFLPPRRPPVPEAKRADRVRNPIDAFLLRDLEDAGLEPAPEASRRVLLRRVRFDLTGLPPSP